jgi:7-cyano-7-deazaguanine synthase in queuosine biosynthesis
MQVNIPVNEVNKWIKVKTAFENCLSFLTGDIWHLKFEQLQNKLYYPKKPIEEYKKMSFNPDSICLFSGGLDSLVGALDWLETNKQGNLLLVSHHDSQMKGPLKDQNNLLKVMQEHYQGRINSLKVRVGQKPAGKETTLRSRSLLFIALGIYAAQSAGEDIPLLIPENGMIAINPPLSPSRRGSCSTRTAHPYFINTLCNILSELGIKNTILNPLALKTKGECLEKCLNKELLQKAALLTVSCAKRGHTRTWINKGTNSCGRCMPCIYRRAALHKINLDNEEYGRNICKGDVDFNSRQILANDLRACLLFLRQNNTKEKIAQLLLANSEIKIFELPEYTDLVLRSMEEIRSLIRDKGSDEIKDYAGIKI